MNNKIIISNITKKFNDTLALNNVSTEFITGNLYGIIGPAGAGKTTLFRIMLNLMIADSGKVIYKKNNKKISFNSIRQHIAYMPQSQSLYSDLSIEEHLEFFRKLYGINDADFEIKRKQLLSLTNLEKFTDRPAGNLSGGMYKKLGLMCALLRSPEIMFLDEPTNGVDPISRREFWNLLHISVSSGIMVIMTTAYMDEAERCDDVILMDKGFIIDYGNPQNLLKQCNCQNFDEFFLHRGIQNVK